MAPNTTQELSPAEKEFSKAQAEFFASLRALAEAKARKTAAQKAMKAAEKKIIAEVGVKPEKPAAGK